MTLTLTILVHSDRNLVLRASAAAMSAISIICILLGISFHHWEKLSMSNILGEIAISTLIGDVVSCVIHHQQP